jgi:hypothetical protein
MDLGLSLDMSQPSAPEPVPSIEWESWGEEATIELCEVHLGFDGTTISMYIILPYQPNLFMICIRHFDKSPTTDIPFFWTAINPTLIPLCSTSDILRSSELAGHSEK